MERVIEKIKQLLRLVLSLLCLVTSISLAYVWVKMTWRLTVFVSQWLGPWK